MQAKFRIKVFLLLFLMRKTVLCDGDKIEFSDSGDENVEFYPHPVHDVYFLSMDENVPASDLFFIKKAKAPLSLSLSDPCTAFKNSYEITPKDNQTFVLHLNSSIDYEQKNCQEIRGSISDQSGGQMTFRLSINNLDDNDPQLFLSSKCEMNENTDYSKQDSPCTITITDADGMLNDTTFSITPTTFDADVGDYFDVGFEETPDDSDTQSSIKIFLKDDKQLDFETMSLHSFTLTAQQPVSSNDAIVVVNVKDMPDKPPKWLKMFTTQQFPENEDQIFNVQAVDGDVGINSQIFYEISKNGCDGKSCTITIDSNGTINVKNIDREETGDTILSVIRAYEKDQETENDQTLEITFFIDDQDDNTPTIQIENQTFEIDENFFGKITSFTAKDMDLGDNGSYDIQLACTGAIDYSKAFDVIPTSGYQEGDFTLTVHDSSFLDYENDDWKQIKFELQAIERADPTHIDSKSVTINLKDLNDEAPVFTNPDDSVEIKESVGENFKIFNAKATDADAGDIVSYEIVGVWSQNLNIDKNGLITTKKDGVFDYELLQQIVLQIKATDEDNVHTTYKSLTINVIDVDDEPPSIKVSDATSSNRFTVKEDVESGTRIQNALITVSDPDTKPKLSIEIDWSKSVITKNSVIVKSDEKWKCFELSVEEHGENDQSFNANLMINDECSPDFELYDAVSIYLSATDTNTEIGEKSFYSMILVNIEDVNDNPPVFVLSSYADLRLTDGNPGGTRIGTISATDADMNEHITFHSKPLSKDADWVDLDENSGELKVKSGVIIDDDVPKRDKISFEITAFDNDQTHKTIIQIDIQIDDINDNSPSISNKISSFNIEEKTETLDDFIVLNYEDNDRDAPFNVVKFKFDTSISNDASNRFSITDDGKISVDLKNGAILDRDTGPSSFVLPILAFDNPSGTTQLEDHLDVTIILDDINDHKPQMVESSLESSESNVKGDKLGPLTTIDPDEGDNSRVKFEIVDIVPFSQQNPNILSIDSFQIESEDDETAYVILNQDLRNFYGSYNMTIKTTDYGDPPQSRDNILQFDVKKFNFEQPIFVFPSKDQEIVLSKDQVTSSDSQLKLFNGENLRDFEVDDLQNHKWSVTFQIVNENGGAPTMFTVKNFQNWKARLQLLQTPTEENTKYNVTISANLDGDHEASEEIWKVATTVRISFFDPSDPPQFTETSYKMSFEENSFGTPQSIPQATYGADVQVTPFYLLLDETDTFEVDPNTGSVSLKLKLDYEKVQSYNIRIVASSSINVPTNPPENSILNVKIDVININEYAPDFGSSKFVGAFLKTYNKDSTIITVEATDEDLPDSNNLHYSLIGETECEGLTPPSSAFSVGPSDGKVTPNFILTSGMSGYCTIEVSVADNADEYDTVHTESTPVQINLINDDELVLFVFLNTDGDVVDKQNQITDAINGIFEDSHYESHLADYTYNEETANTTADFFFLNKDTQNPVKASEIRGILTDYMKFSTLQKSLASIQIYLQSFLADNVVENGEDAVKKWFMIATIILAILLVQLAIFFYFRNRTLTRRITNLTTTKFGSQDSGLNRAGLATVPTTNKNAVEGSNPVFKFENPSHDYNQNVDRNSIISCDSDLFGVENNPEFDV